MADWLRRDPRATLAIKPVYCVRQAPPSEDYSGVCQKAAALDKVGGSRSGGEKELLISKNQQQPIRGVLPPTSQTLR